MDLLRALAAALVAISHVRDLLWQDFAGGGILLKLFYFVTGFGHAGVIVFFVLSGFWITRTVMRRIDSPAFWTNYLIDRLARLWVVLIPVLLLGGLLDLVGAALWQLPLYNAQTGAHSVGGPVIDHLNLTLFAAGTVFLSAIVVDPLGSNAPLWSLSYEFWYYLWFPALALSLRRKRPVLALLAFAMALFPSQLALGFVSWLAGSVLHFAVERSGRAAERPAGQPRDVIGSLALWGGLAATGGCLVLARTVQSYWTDPPLAMAFAVFLFGLCRTNPTLPGFLAPAARFGANSSFSLYAIHFPLAMAVASWLTIEGRRAPTLGLFGITLAIMAGLIALAWAFSRATEAHTPAIRGWARSRLTAQPA